MALQAANISLYVITFNCGRALIDVDAFASHLFSGLASATLPDLFVLSIQEIAPISLSFLGGSSLVPYFNRFSQAVHKAAGKNVYNTVAIRNLGMTGLMVFAKDPSAVQDVEHAGVGVGVSEMGDKGAVGVRFTYQVQSSSTELTFVATHLRAMEDEVEGRNEDWQNIVRRLVFSSEAGGKSAVLSNEERPLLSISPRDATIYKPTSHLFVAGDFNYRTSSIKPAPDDHIHTFPQPQDDRSSPNHYSNLYKLDQLNQEKGAGRTLHGLTEAPVTFPPTYKYNDKGPFLTADEDTERWNWASHRWPSWCDRILYLDMPSWIKDTKARIIPHKYIALPLFPSSDHRPVALGFTVPLVSIPAPDEDEEGNDPRIHPPFAVDVDWKTRHDRARILETIVGYLLYFSSTYEGGALFLASLAGGVGAVFALRAILEM